MKEAGLKDHLQLHLVVLIWGFTAILGKLIKIPPVELVFFRTLLAVAGLAVLLYVRKKSFHIGKQQIGKILATGAIIAAHWILFFGAARVANISVCLAGMATTSLWTSILEPLLSNKRIRPLEICIGLVVMAGLYVIFHFEFNHALGVAMAVASAMLAALFSVLNGQFTQKHDSFVITFYEMAGACLSTVLFLCVYPYFLPENEGINLAPTLSDWFYIAILAWVCTVFAFSKAVQLMQKFSVFAMNLIVNLEPVYGIIMAFLLFKDAERMTTGFYLGTLVILASVIMYPILDSYSKKRQPQV